MKVLHLLTTNSFSGAENVVCQIIRMFQDDFGKEMMYCSPDGPIRNALQEKSVHFLPLAKFNVAEVGRVMNEYRPDLVHAHDMRAGYIAAKTCGKTPLVLHIHNNNFNSRGLTMKSVAFLLPAIKAKHIFYVSQSSYNGYFFHALFKNKSSVLYNVIDVETLYERVEKDSSTYNYDVLYLGRLSYPKNPIRLINVIKKAVQLEPQIHVGIIGTGELDDAVKNEIARLGLHSNVDMLGFKSNPLKILKDSKVMVMTSLWEGTPMCALEAMALGVPIVSTPTDGLKDLVKEGITGFLSDDDDILAKRIVEIVSNKELYNILHNNTLQESGVVNNSINYKKNILKVYGE